MSLPQNIEPKPVLTPAPEDSPLDGVLGDIASPDATVEEETPEEVSSDAVLRTWAKDNGIDDVPASGRLSATWRDQITTAMTAVLDPKEEVSAEATSSPESPTPTTTETGTSGEETPLPVEEPVVVQPEFETGVYRSVFKAPNTFVSSQAFTA